MTQLDLRMLQQSWDNTATLLEWVARADQFGEEDGRLTLVQPVPSPLPRIVCDRAISNSACPAIASLEVLACQTKHDPYWFKTTEVTLRDLRHQVQELDRARRKAIRECRAAAWARWRENRNNAWDSSDYFQLAGDCLRLGIHCAALHVSFLGQSRHSAALRFLERYRG